MKIVFFGSTNFSYEMLISLIENDLVPEVVFSIPEYFSISYSSRKVRNFNFFDFESFCKKSNIPHYFVEHASGKKITNYFKLISRLNADVILVLGWYYMVPKSIRELAKYGAWGIHASLLPKYRGGAPLVWAIINGEENTGVTLFRLGSGVDDGDIIDKKSFKIDFNDSIGEVYDKSIKASKEMLIHNLKNIDKVQFVPQNVVGSKIWPQRKPEDGEIDLSRPAIEIYNFIRAQSYPYPGAFIKTVDGKKLVIDKAHIEPF